MNSKKLKSIRNMIGITQSQMADSLGIKQGSYSDIERGKSPITKSLELLVIYRFSVNQEWIDSGKGPMFNNGETIKEEEAPSIIGSNTNLEKELIACQKELIQLRQQNSSLKEENKELNIEIKEKLKRIIKLQDKLLDI